MIWGLDGNELPQQESFPLEPVAVFVGQEKMTSNTSEEIRFWAHLKLTEEKFFCTGTHGPARLPRSCMASSLQHTTQRALAVSTVGLQTGHGVAGTNVNLVVIDEEQDPHCPSCGQALETCAHVLHCEEAGRVDALKRLIDWLDDWLRNAGTEPNLQECLIEYTQGYVHERMEDIA